MRKLVLLVGLLFSISLIGQTNISITSTTADNIVKGNYNPANYTATTVINTQGPIACMLDDELSPDSLLSYLEVLETFYTRHTYSDTLSADTGIGAARRWVYKKFQSFSSRNDNRLQPAYLKFDQISNPCGPANGLKNVLGVLPGTDPNSPILIIEAHMDSRCEGGCDVNCFAPGIDDNGSGTALVIELARVMSQFTFEHTIVFMLTVGEEQGLLGAEAMAEYCQQNNIAVKAVQNNDVVGGIVCGETASFPGCDPAFSVDSTMVRLYASTAFLLPHQGFARTVKMYYDEKMKGSVKVPMNIEIINREDRVGRGGDHIPFRAKGFTSIRFSSAHEHGDAGVSDTSYNDHQHTSRDVLGKDLNNDGILDTFYVDVNYLKRNTLINGVSLAMLALGMESPDWTIKNDAQGARVEITNASSPEYRVGVREFSGSTPDFDAVYRFTGNTFTVPDLQNGTFYFISVAAIDANGIMSPFTKEERVLTVTATPAGTQDNFPYSLDCNLFSVNERPLLRDSKVVEFLSISPNPTTDVTTFTIKVNEWRNTESARMLILDNVGREVQSLSLELQKGDNKVQYQHKVKAGMYYCQLIVDGKVVDVRKMVVHHF